MWPPWFGLIFKYFDNCYKILLLRFSYRHGLIHFKPIMLFLNDIWYEIYPNFKPKVEFWKLRIFTEIFSLNEWFPVNPVQCILRETKNTIHLFHTKPSVFCSEKCSSGYRINNILWEGPNMLLHHFSSCMMRALQKLL